MRLSISKKDYQTLCQKLTPPSPIGRDMLGAFFIGGGICLIGQLFLELYSYWGLDEEAAGLLASASLILIGSILSALGLYAKLAKLGGAGTLVPITGFSNSMTSAAIEFKTEGLVTGLGAKMFIIAGPVIVYGIAASILYGILYYLFS